MAATHRTWAGGRWLTAQVTPAGLTGGRCFPSASSVGSDRRWASRLENIDTRNLSTRARILRDYARERNLVAFDFRQRHNEFTWPNGTHDGRFRTPRRQRHDS